MPGLLLITRKSEQAIDEHFGDWVILPLSKHPGVIRLKINPTTSQNAIKLLIPFFRLHSSGQFRNHLVILSPKPFFYPEPISTGKYNTHLARELVRSGCLVEVVALHPVYPEWRPKMDMKIIAETAWRVIRPNGAY